MNEMINKFKAWWMPLAIREKQAVLIGGAAIILFLVYALIWSPLADHAESLRKQIKTGQKTLLFMQAAEQEISQNVGAVVTTQVSSSPVQFLSYLQAELDSSGLTSSVTQIKQSSQDAITVKFEKVDFDRLMTLLINVMKTQRVSVDQLTAVAGNSPGIANVDLVLKLG